MHRRKWTLEGRASLLALVGVLLVYSSAALELVQSTASPLQSKADYWGVGVFYYVWYGAPPTEGYMHWNHSILPHWNEHVQAKHAGKLRQPFEYISKHALTRQQHRICSTPRHPLSGKATT